MKKSQTNHYVCAVGLLTYLALGLGSATPNPSTHNSTYSNSRYERSYSTSPAIRTVSNEFFDASIEPVKNYRAIEAFLLKLTNKTDKTLEIDWNRTLFLEGGQTSGGFMFEGVQYIRRNDPKQPDLVLPNAQFSKAIWPNQNVKSYGGEWLHMPIGTTTTGECGVSLSVKVGDKEVRENLTLKILF